MAQMFNFFINDIFVRFWAFADSVQIFSGLSLLDFSIGMFLINLIVANFIIMAKRSAYGTGRPSKKASSGKSNKGG